MERLAEPDDQLSKAGVRTEREREVEQQAGSIEHERSIRELIDRTEIVVIWFVLGCTTGC
jgi:lysozyme family protein